MIDCSDLLHPLCPKCQIHEGMRNNPATAEWTCGGCHITWNSDYLMGWNHGLKQGTAEAAWGNGDVWARFIAELKAKRTNYAGVYGPRVVTFWRDTGGAAHFGLPNEPDGKGSQPTSHWLPLPKLPKN